MLVLLAPAGCWSRAELPAETPPAAALGRCGGPVERAKLCGDWGEAVQACEGDAEVHAAFPELVPQACFVRVRYERGRLPRADPIPAGCGYSPAQARSVLEEQAQLYEAIAQGRLAGSATTSPPASAATSRTASAATSRTASEATLPPALACALPDEVRRVAAAVNGATLRAMASGPSAARRYPYAAVSTFGFGYPTMGSSRLVSWRPGEACPQLDKREMDKLSINRIRAGRAAAGYHARLAPVITVSGGAVHAPLNESFMLAYLASCRFGVPLTAILLDPCADHTHTNVRNTGALLIGLGAKTGYIVTDSGLQGRYLQEWTGFSIIGGSIDQRALRDWGYLLGSWRQASVGMEAGFWFSPYRFFGETRAEVRDLQCVSPSNVP